MPVTKMGRTEEGLASRASGVGAGVVTMGECRPLSFLERIRMLRYTWQLH